MRWETLFLSSLLLATISRTVLAQELSVVPDVEGQPLAANARRLVETLVFLGRPVSDDLAEQIEAAANDRDAGRLQELLDEHVLLAVHINPEYRVKVQRGPAEAVIQQAGYTPVLVKIHNEGTVTERLRISSPQAGKIYAGVSQGSLSRQQQLELGEDQNEDASSERFLDVEMFALAADDRTTERPLGRVLDCPDQFQRSRPTGGENRIRRRPGDTGPWLPQRGPRSCSTYVRPFRLNSRFLITMRHPLRPG